MSHRHSELLRLAQAGQPEEALTQAREHLDQGETLGILYVQAVALHCLGNHKAAADAAARMLDRAATAGINAEAISERRPSARQPSGQRPSGQRP